MTDKEKAKIRAEIIMSLKEGYKPKVKQTAVEWLVQRLAENGILHSSDISKAKELEKQQIIDAHLKGQREDIDFINEAKDEAEQYYNKTFKSE
jgi:hypothetical protein